MKVKEINNETNLIMLDYFGWIERYKIIMDPEDNMHSPLDVDPRCKKISDNTFYRALQENKIWTLIEGDKEVQIVSGYHHVNRLKHYMAEVPYDTNHSYQIIN
jgi:hypothetical protein